MSLKLIRTLTNLAFSLFVILSLTTPSWRYGPFSWWPVARFEELAGGPVELGALNGLPLLFGAGWLLGRGRRIWQWGDGAVTLAFAALTLWALVRMDWGTFRLVFIYGGAFILAWLVYLYLLNARPPLAPVLVAVILAQSVVATGQFLLQRDLGLAALGELPLNPAFEGVTVLSARGRPWLRGYGLTAHPNLLGAILAGLLVMLLPHLSRARGRQRAWLMLAMTVGLAGLFFSFSRAAWLAASLGTLVWLALRPRSRGQSRSWRAIVRYALPLLAVGFFLFAYQDLVLSRFVGLDRPLEAQSIARRISDAQRALRFVGEHPWLGTGVGRFSDAAGGAANDPTRVHNVLLLAAAETGVVGALLVLALYAAPFLSRAPSGPYPERAWRQLRARRLAPWVVMLVVTQLDITLWVTGNWQTAILFGIIAARAAETPESERGGEMYPERGSAGSQPAAPAKLHPAPRHEDVC